MTTPTSPLTLVTTATGKTGSRVAARLLAAGRPVRLGSRRADPPFDWADPATWAPALDGVGAAYLAYVPDIALPGAAEAIGAVATLAVDRGVERLVLLSGRGEPGAERAERFVQDSGAAWTVVRSAFFAQNFTEGFWFDAVADGGFPLHVDDVAEPFVDVDDVADIAAAALLDDGHAGRMYEVTGPRLLTFTEALGEITRVTGRPVELVRISAGEMRDGLVAAELPVEDATALVDLFSDVLDGRNAHLADGVQQALGRPAGDFADVVRAAAAAGAWTTNGAA